MSACNFSESSELWFPPRPVDAAVCPECDGAGWVLFAHRGAEDTERGECPTCEGRGWVAPDDEAVN